MGNFYERPSVFPSPLGQCRIQIMMISSRDKKVVSTFRLFLQFHIFSSDANR